MTSSLVTPTKAKPLRRRTKTNRLMAKLNAEKRNALPAKDFAGPDRSYPINDKSHARNALARASGKSVAGEVKAKVEKKFPNIKVDGKGNIKNPGGRPPSKPRGTSDGAMRRT